MPFSNPNFRPNTPMLHNLQFIDPFNPQNATSERHPQIEVPSAPCPLTISSINHSHEHDSQEEKKLYYPQHRLNPEPLSNHSSSLSQFVTPTSLDLRTSFDRASTPPLFDQELLAAAMSSTASAYSNPSSPEPHSPTWTADSSHFIQVSSFSSSTLPTPTSSVLFPEKGNRVGQGLQLPDLNFDFTQENIKNGFGDRSRADSWDSTGIPESVAETYPMRLGRSLPSQLDQLSTRYGAGDRASFMDNFHGYESISTKNHPEFFPKSERRQLPGDSLAIAALLDLSSSSSSSSQLQSGNQQGLEVLPIVPSQPALWTPSSSSAIEREPISRAKINEPVTPRLAVREENVQVARPAKRVKNNDSGKGTKVSINFDYEAEPTLLSSRPPASGNVIVEAQDPKKIRSDRDLYTPRWIRGSGKEKEGFCSLCPEGEWYKLKVSAYNYHLAYTHGISASSGSRFDAPVEMRINSKDNKEVLCKCGKWIKLLGRGAEFQSYFRHARECHNKLNQSKKGKKEEIQDDSSSISGASTSSKRARLS